MPSARQIGYTFTDQITGTIRQLQHNAEELVTIAGRVAANTGYDRNQAHQVLERCYQQVEQTSGQLSAAPTWQTQNQFQQLGGSNR